MKWVLNKNIFFCFLKILATSQTIEENDCICSWLMCLGVFGGGGRKWVENYRNDLHFCPQGALKQHKQSHQWCKTLLKPSFAWHTKILMVPTTFLIICCWTIRTPSSARQLNFSLIILLLKLLGKLIWVYSMSKAKS